MMREAVAERNFSEMAEAQVSTIAFCGVAMTWHTAGVLQLAGAWLERPA